MSGGTSSDYISTAPAPSKKVYLDYNSTTPMAPEVTLAVEHAMHDAWGNPSSPHEEGLRANSVITQARENVAKMLGASSRDILFTSGGTEVNNNCIWYFLSIG